MINYNIRRIIMDKVALIRWQNCIKRVNSEYHGYYYECGGGRIGSNSCDECQTDYICYYNYRPVWYPNIIGNHKIHRCKYGIIHPRNAKLNIRIPEYYWYTSGMNHPYAYEKEIIHT